MPKQFLIYSVIVFVGLAAFAWAMPRSADASGFEPTAGSVDSADADFCFGPGNQGVGFACNSLCFAVQDPSYVGLPINCPGTAATITFATAPSTVYCGSQSTLTVTLADAKNLAVADDTLVTFTTDGGYVSESSATSGGVAYATFRVPPKTSGVAHIVATVGSVRAEKRIDVGVNC
jgi:hypothetical protein